jgi:hypothetical protein
MSTKSTGIIYCIIGIGLFAVSALDLGWWISVSSDGSKSLQQMNVDYESLYPEFLRAGRLLRVCNILILALAVLFFSLAKARLPRKWPVIVLIVLSFVLIAWQLLSFA